MRNLIPAVSEGRWLYFPILSLLSAAIKILFKVAAYVYSSSSMSQIEYRDKMCSRGEAKRAPESGGSIRDSIHLFFAWMGSPSAIAGSPDCYL